MIQRKHYSRAPWEVEVGLPWEKKPFEFELITREKDLEDDFTLKKWEKFLDLESLLPNMRVWKLDTAK